MIMIMISPAASSAGPHEVFTLAARKLHEIGEDSGRGYDVEILTMGRGRHVTGASGLSLVAKGPWPEFLD